MENWTLKTVATGLYGKTPSPTEPTLCVLADGWDGSANIAVDPLTGELYTVEQITITHEGGHAAYWYKGYAVESHYCGMKVPVSNDEDINVIRDAKIAYRKFRRRLEDALRKTAGPNQLSQVAGILNVHL